MSIKYSIIIPHFNCEEGLGRLLRSIPNLNHIEVLVVDDRSCTDSYKDVVKECGLPNIRCFLNDRVKSGGACRNIGLEHALGEYLIFADSDDYFAKNAFDAIDDCISENPCSDLFFFNVSSVDDQGNVSTRHLKNRSLVMNFIHQKGDWFNERIRLTHNVPWGKVIKKQLVDEGCIRFDQTIIANDGVFSLKVGKAARDISASENIIYCVTSSGSSLTGHKDVIKYRVRLEVYVRYFSLLDDNERQKVNASPLPLLYKSLGYGLGEFFRSFIFLRKSGVNIFKFFKLNKNKIKVLLGS